MRFFFKMLEIYRKSQLEMGVGLGSSKLYKEKVVLV
jgi:hypothetical protein